MEIATRTMRVLRGGAVSPLISCIRSSKVCAKTWQNLTDGNYRWSYDHLSWRNPIMVRNCLLDWDLSNKIWSVHRQVLNEDDGKGYGLASAASWPKNSDSCVWRLNIHSSDPKNHPEAHDYPTQSNDGIRECVQRVNGVLTLKISTNS